MSRLSAISPLQLLLLQLLPLPESHNGAGLTVPPRSLRLGRNNVDGFLIQPKTVHCSSNSSFKWKGVPARSLPPPPSSSSTTTPQSTRCIVKKWEGTLEPSCSMKVGCSVCLLMRWKEDGSEKWNKVREHIKRRRKKKTSTQRASSGGGTPWKRCRHFFFLLVNELRSAGKKLREK